MTYKLLFWPEEQESAKLVWLAKCWSMMIHKAKRDLQAVTITPTQYRYLLSFNCQHCKRKLTGNGINLDRQDESKGYEWGNVWPSCGVCNVKRYRMRMYKDF